MGDSPHSSSGLAHRGINKEMYSLTTFNHLMDNDPGPMLKWAADCNFTAADVKFLLFVRNWKSSWGGPGRRQRTLSPSQSRACYEDAAIIFFTFINPETSTFTLNLSSRAYRELAKYFVGLTYDLDGEGTCFNNQHQVTPWENDEHASQSQRARSFDRVRLHRLGGNGGDDGSDDEDDYTIPRGFTLSVFDEACKIIREDVFHNTWTR